MNLKVLLTESVRDSRGKDGREVQSDKLIKEVRLCRV